MHRAKKTYLAEMLLQQELITREQLDNAINLQKKSDKKIGELLVELGYIKEEQLLLLLSEQLHIPYIDLKHFPISQEVIKLLPEFSARHYQLLFCSLQALIIAPYAFHRYPSRLSLFYCNSKL